MADLSSMKDLINIWIEEKIKLVNNSILFWRRKARKSDKEVSTRIWSELPSDILELVIRTIDSPKDYLNFIAVCKTWHTIAHEIKFNSGCKLPIFNPLPKKYPFPMLLQPHGQDSEVHYLYSIITRKVHKLYAPELSNKWIPGSWRGWLVTIDINDGNQIHLFNPITKGQITLPPFSNLPKPISSSFVDKIVVVSPSKVDVQSNCMIVALMTGTGVFNFCRIGDDKWKKIYPSIPSISDAIEFKGHLHAVDFQGTLFIIETSPSTKVTPVAVVHQGRWPDRQYLVESSGDLLLVSRFQEEIENDQYARTVVFKVYRLVESQTKYRKAYSCAEDRQVHYSEVPVCKIWEEIDSLHGQMLFVGYNRTLCLDSKLYLGCKGNCIYFADNCPPIDECRAHGRCADPHDNGVYHMNNKKIEYFMEGISDRFPLPAVWFSPNPW